MSKKISLDTAKEIVETQQMIDSLTSNLKRYSNDEKKMDGQFFSVTRISDSCNADMRWMINYLDMEDIEAINRYIVNRFKKTIRDGKARLAELGVE